MASQIFISYRRTGGDVTAKLICETLKNKGYTVFYDFDNLKGGYFDTSILEAIEECNDFILVLPPHGLDRCVNDDDWVRNEIRHALQRGNNVNIIPVILPGFEFPKDLPDDIAAVSRVNGVSFNMNYFNAVIGSIIDRLKSKPYGQAAPTPAPQPAATDDRMQQLLQLASTPEGRALLDSLLKNNTTPTATPQPTPRPEPQPEPQPQPQPEVTPPPPVISQSSEGLDLQLNEDGTEYAVIGLGDCEDTDIVIPKEHEGIPVTSIASKAFYDCYITSVYVPESIKTIEDRAFCSCDSVLKVYISDGVTSIGEYAFASCKALKEIHLPEGLTSLEDSVLARCESLTSIHIPDSVKSIQLWALAGCKSLTSLTIPKGTTYIYGGQVFENCTSLNAFYVHPDNPKLCNHGPHLYSKDMTQLIKYATACNDVVFSVPESVTYITSGAFHSCSRLQSVICPKSGEYISSSAFENCSQLVEITLPKKITSISRSTFWGCSSLKSIIIPNQVKSIDDWAFYKCASLESVTIPPRVSEMEKLSFGYCDTLTSIQYKGTKEMWGNIKLHKDWAKSTPLKVIHCTDGDISL